MRKNLAKINTIRSTFSGTFERFGKKSGWKGKQETTVLFKNIHDSDGSFICDHIWFNLTKQFKLLSLENGDVVQFDARVKKYEKGYKGRREDVYDSPIEIDYKLTYPTHVIKRPT